MRSTADIIAERNIIIRGADVFTEGGFTQVPNAILKAEGISPGAKLVYVSLLSYAWHNEYCFPGQATMAKDIGLSVRSVSRHVKELEEARYIKIKRQGLNKPNIYELFLIAQKKGAGRKRT